MGKNSDKVKIYKGDYGYIKAERKIEIIRTIGLLALPILLYVIGFLSTGSNKNLLTFVAVLGSLPLARSAVSMYLFIRAGVCCSEETYKKIVGSGVQATYYDLYYTSYKKNFPIACVILKRGCFIALTEDKDMLPEDYENHMKEILSNCGGDKITVKLYTDTDKFIERALELKDLEDGGKDYSFILENILSVSI